MFWKRWPAIDRLEDAWRQCLTSGRGMDTVLRRNHSARDVSGWPVACLNLFRACLLELRGSRRLPAQTAAALKLCVGEGFTGRSLTRELFITGYVAGSTRGSATTLLAYMLTQCEKRPFEVREVQAFLRSAARLKATFVVYGDSRLRARDAWRAVLNFSERL